ncbi:GntR family transcriptional regulator, partial [Pseudonocardia sulfidoxydans]
MSAPRDADGPTGPRLSRRPLGQQIADLIRNDVLYGRLRSGTKLGQQQLCERYGTSRI